MRILTRLFATCLLCLPACGQALPTGHAFHQYQRAQWLVADGLPQHSVTAFAQDRDGYLWIGTQAYLARFDGVRFVSYSPDNEPGLPGNLIRALHTARDGKLWIATYKGLSVYDGGAFSTVPAAMAQRFPALDITALAEDGAGQIWVASESGLFRVLAGRLHRIADGPELVHSVMARDDGIWVGARGAVHHRSADGSWSREALPVDPATTVTRLVQAQGRLWAATGLGLFYRSPDGWHAFATAPLLERTPVELLYADRDGNLWAGGDPGLARIRDARLSEFVAAGGPGGIIELRVAFEDRESNLWLGSRSDGLLRIHQSQTRRFSTPEGLDARLNYSLSPDPDQQRIWVGGSGGISLFERGRFTLVVPAAQLPHPRAYNLLAEADRLWIGTRHGLALVEHRGAQAGKVQLLPLFAPLAATTISGIIRTSNGDLWIGSTKGMFRARAGQLRRFGATEGLSNVRIRHFHFTRDGQLLVGTEGGLFALRDERFAAVGLGQGLPAELDVTAITELADGRIVIGTRSERTFFSQAGRWHALGQAQGFPANSPFYLVEHAGFLWAAGASGITRVPIADLGPFAHARLARVRGEVLLNEGGYPHSGQQGVCCNGAGTAKGFLRNNSLWLPSDNGIVELDSNSIVKNLVPPNAVIEQVLVKGQWRQAGTVRARQLPDDARDLNFEFTVLSLQDPKSISVEYRLAGYDRQWQHSGALQRNARYTNLAPGQYVFEVRGSNNDGLASITAARLPFSIQARFHETWPFKALLTLLLAALALAGYRWQQHRHRVQQRVLEGLITQRTESLEVANSRLELANRSLEEASLTDPLTGLRNRRFMISQIPSDLDYYDRRVEQGQCVGEVIVFALLDIDHFKWVNDMHGHGAGDRVLTQFAQLLVALMRTGDYVVRWGGEEFLLVLRPMLSSNLGTLGARLCATVAAHPFDIGDQGTLRITCSAGFSEYPLFRDHDGPASWETMVELADQALYYVKAHGRNGWAAFRPTAQTQVPTLLQQLHEGADAMLADGRLSMVGSTIEENRHTS